MDNHLHLLLRLDPAVGDAWSDVEVVRRWFKLYPPRGVDRKPLSGKQADELTGSIMILDDEALLSVCAYIDVNSVAHKTWGASFSQPRRMLGLLSALVVHAVVSATVGEVHFGSNVAVQGCEHCFCYSDAQSRSRGTGSRSLHPALADQVWTLVYNDGAIRKIVKFIALQ